MLVNMKKTFSMLMVAFAAIVFVSCTKDPVEQKTGTPSGKKVLVAYFSFTNKTEAFAEKIAGFTGGDLYEITPEEPYGPENNNFNDENSRAYQEQYGPESLRPAIRETLENAAQYDAVFLGCPIWYGKSPRVILTFLDKYGFQGKKVITFVTSDATDVGCVNSELTATYPDIKWIEGLRLNGMSDADLQAWVEACLSDKQK